MGEWRYNSILSLDTRWMWSASRPGRGKSYRCGRRPGRGGEDENSLPVPESEHRSSS